MRKIILASLLLASINVGCSKYGQRGTACISADKTTVVLNETVTISNCGDELPSDMVDVTIDWGDGTIDNGQVGSHAYSAAGTYEIRLMLNGDYAADVADVEEGNVKQTIIVQ